MTERLIPVLFILFQLEIIKHGIDESSCIVGVTLSLPICRPQLCSGVIPHSETIWPFKKQKRRPVGRLLMKLQIG
jgi:hypothetical protein